MLFLLTFFILSVDFTRYTPGSYPIILSAGIYNISCYGAQGGQGFRDGDPLGNGGYGAFASGILKVTGKDRKFWVYVGGQPTSTADGSNPGGTNGGGAGGQDNRGWEPNGHDSAGGGGGATDLRIDSTTKASRIIVAAGGSGAATACNGAPGGALYGLKMLQNGSYVIDEKAGQNGALTSGTGGSGTASEKMPDSGGGGGYRGGPATGKDHDDLTPCSQSIASSGCSYISGYFGCSNFTKTVNGIKETITFTGGYMQTGVKSGNGKFTITNITVCPENCSSCNESGVCFSCHTNFLKNNKCVTDCGAGFYGSANKCRPCSAPCKTCENTATSCLTCIDGYFMNHDGTCVAGGCPDGTYYDSNTKKCAKCTTNCADCISSSKCISCKDNYVLNDGQCVLKTACGTGKVNTGLACEKCHPYCKTCSPRVDTCTSCVGNYYLHGTECVPSCPDGKFESGAKCSECKSPCKTCTGFESQCTTCDDNQFLHESEHKCYEACPPGTTQSGAVCINF